jgi:flagellar hook-associated protein 2
MASFGVDGLVSGLDTTSLINSLMQLEARPQALLKTKQSTTQSFISALQSLNTKMASLATVAGGAAKAGSWDAWKATSSASSVTATASATAQPGTLTFTVDAVAATQASVTNAFTDASTLFPTLPPVITIKKADGTMVTVEPATGDLATVTRAINDASGAGVKATAVRVSNTEPPEYRLQFTGTTTGTDGAFEVYAGSAADVGAGTATRLDGNQVRAASDATVTLWKGTGMEQSFSQSANTFAGLLTGVDVTVSKVTGPGEDPVTVTVARDGAAVEKLAADLTAGLNVVLSEITSRTRTTTTTGSDGKTTVTGGLFSGDSAVRALTERVTSAASAPVNGRSPAEVGIVIGRDGTYTFDAAKFRAALAADPAKVQDMVMQLAGRVAGAATGASAPVTGSLTLKIQGQEGMVKNIGTQIESWDRRLELRRGALQRTYSALEVSLSKLQTQSSWLAGQLAGLPSYSSSS